MLGLPTFVCQGGSTAFVCFGRLKDSSVSMASLELLLYPLPADALPCLAVFWDSRDQQVLLNVFERNCYGKGL